MQGRSIPALVKVADGRLVAAPDKHTSSQLSAWLTRDQVWNHAQSLLLHDTAKEKQAEGMIRNSRCWRLYLRLYLGCPKGVCYMPSERWACYIPARIPSMLGATGH